MARHRSVVNGDGVVTIEPLSGIEQRDERSVVAGHLPFEVSVIGADSAATVCINGDLDCYTAPQLRSALLALVEEGTRHVTVDIAGTQVLDSTGLSVLVGGMKRLRDHGGSMVVKSPNEATRKLFEITGLDSVLDIF